MVRGRTRGGYGPRCSVSVLCNRWPVMSQYVALGACNLPPPPPPNQCPSWEHLWVGGLVGGWVPLGFYPPPPPPSGSRLGVVAQKPKSGCLPFLFQTPPPPS